MSTLVVSDLHLKGPTDPNQVAFLDFLHRVPFSELVVAGDLFDLWMAPRGQVPTPAAPVIEVFARLVDRGVPVTWLRGNHDPGPQDVGRGIVRADLWRRPGKQKVEVVHGDAESGLLHHAIRRVLASRTLGTAAGAVGVERLWRLGNTLSDQRRQVYSPAGLQTALMQQNRLADKRLATDVDVVVVGHSHAPGVVPRPQGTLVNLGDWLEHRSYGRIDDVAVRLMHWDGTREIPVESGPPQRRPKLLRSAAGTG